MEERTEEALDLLIREADSLIQTLQALRLLQSSTEPHAVSLDKSPKWVETIEEAMQSLPAAKRRTFSSTIAASTPFMLGLANGSISTTTRQKDEPDGETWETIPAEHVIPEAFRERVLGPTPLPEKLTKDADFRLTEHAGRYRVIIQDDEIRLQFWKVASQVERLSSSPTHVELLHRSLLTMAVSSFEVFVSSVYRAFLMVHYRAADDADVKRFALSDLMAFGSMEDAVAETIYQLSDSFSRKGVRAWAKWFSGKPLSLDVAAMALDWEKTVEVFERRNLAVHNNSRATRQYLLNTPTHLVGDLSEGDHVSVDDAYLREVFERLETLGILLAFNLRIKVFKKNDLDHAASWINAQQFQALRSGNYATVRQIGSSAQDSPELDLQSSLLLRVNRWLAMKKTGEFGDCRKEVETWDTSALMDTFDLARSILLDERDEAIGLVGQCITSGHLDAEGLLTWPLLDDLREDGSLNEALEGQGVELPDALEVDGADESPPKITAVSSEEQQNDDPPGLDMT